MSRKNKFLVGVSPLGLLALSACGGGSTTTTYSAASGKAQSGPLQNATVFLDYNKDGVQDAGETSVTTGDDGSFSLTPTQATYNVVVTTDASTTDSTINGVVSGLTLIAPKGADGAVTMVTPATTMVSNMMAADASLTASAAMANVATALGFDSTKYNPLTFDAFADTSALSAADKLVYDALALEVEKTSKKIMTVVNTFAAAVEGSGASEADAFATAFGSVTSVLTAKIAASEVLDFDVAADITAVTTQLSADISKMANANKAVFDGMTTLEASIANVVSIIDSVTDIENTADAFQTIGLLTDQVKLAATNESVNLANDGAYKGQDADGIAESATVTAAAPALVFNGDLVALGLVTNSVSQKVTIKSAGNDSALSFTVVGTTGLDDIDAISVDAAVGLDGSLVFTGAIVNDQAQKVTITSSGDDATVTFRIVGTDAGGNAIAENLSGASLAAATSLGEYLTVSSITATGTPAGTVMAGFVPTALTEVLSGSNSGTAITEGSFLTITSITADGASAGTVEAGVLGTLTTVVTDPDAISLEATVAANAQLAMVGGGTITPAMAAKVTISSTGDDSAMSFLVSGTNAGLANANGISTSAAVGNDAFLDIGGALAANIPTGGNSGDVTNLIAHKVTISSTGDDSGITFTVVGTDALGDPQTEASITGANVGTATSTLYFLKITSIEADGDPAGSVSAGISGEIQEKVTGANTATATTATLFETITGIKAEGTPAVKVSAGVLGNVNDSSISFSDAALVQSAKDNTAPVDITVASTYLESDATLSVGNLSTVDANQASGHKYTLVGGTDAASFTLTEAGALSFVTQPDYETKTLYSINVETKDSGSKTLVKTIEIAITDADEAPVITAVGGSVTEDDATNGTVTGTLSGVDPEGMTVTYSAASLTGEYGGQLVLDVATGAYTYTMNNDNGSVQDLQSDATLTETFTVSAFDGAISGSGSLSFTINGADDVYLAAPTAGALTEGSTASVTGTLSGTDPAGAALTYSISGSIALDGSYSATGTYGTLTVNAATGAYEYKLSDTVGSTQLASTDAIVKDAVATETFKVKVDNGTDRSTKDLTIQITGINDTPVVTAPTTGSLVEGAVANTVTNTLAAVDSDTGETAGVTFGITGGAVTTGVSYLTGTYGTLALTVATGAYTYTLNAADADTVALTAADSVTEPFTVTATDANGAVGSGSLSIAIVGSGITINAIATDDKVNVAEDTAGFNITGRGNVNQTVTLGFNSSLADKTATVDGNGDWTVAIDAADIDTMGEGSESVTATIGSVSSNAKTFSIDTIAPTTTVTAVQYNTVDKQLVVTGTNFDTVGATGLDVKAFVDWTKLVWDTDGDTSDNSVTFAVGDVTSAIVTSATVLTVTLTATKAAALEATTGFAAATAADNVDVGVGFSVDAAGNVATTDAAANVNPSYSDTVRPTVTSFTSSTGDGSFKINAQVNITATLSEVVLSGSGISVTLNDTANTVIPLTNTSNSNTLTGTYTVPANATQADLSVLSYAITAGKTVSDIYGNLLASTAIPTGENLADNQAIVIDTSVPTNAISSVQYNSTDKSLVFTGTDMTTLAVAGTDLKTSLDWTKLNWDLDGDDAATAGKTFVVGDIASAIVTSATVLTVTLTPAAATALEGTVGFAADGLGSTDTADTIDVLAGFSVDAAGNAATTDAAANLSPTYSDATKPTVASFTSSTGDGNYKEGDLINITANMSEVVLDGSSITVTLSTSDTVVLTAATNGTTLVGTYTVPASKNSGDLNISSFAITSAIKDLYGNTLTDTATPTNQNLSDNQAIVIDTTVPTSTITGVSYGKNAGTGATELVFTGTKLGGNLAAINTDVKSSLDWSKLVWDLDASSDNVGVTFAASDFTSAIVTSSTTLTATLTAAKATALEGTTGFAQDGLGSTNTPDNVDIATGFVVDLAGNAATTDAAANLAPTYTDGTKPTVTEFNSTTINGGYKVGDVINITATMSEAVLDGAQITVTLDTGDTVALTAATNGTTLTGDYTVGTGDNSTDLAISSYAVSATVSDLYGNSLSDTSIPASENLSDNKAFVIDTAGPTNTITGAAYHSGDKTLTLSGAGFNTMGTVGSDVKSNMDWSKLVWDLDGSTTNAGATFSVGDVTSAIVTSATVFTITLTDTKAASLTSTVGFGADGLGSTNAADNIDVAAGFSRDASGNAATTDAGANLSPTYSDTVKPLVTSFTSSTADGGYKVGETINITATVGEVILGGSAIKVTLDTGDEVTLTASTNGTTMVGAYTVGAGDSSADLTISQAFSITSAVTDVYGNALSVTTLPANQNLGDNSALVIDTAIPTSTITAASYNSTGGILTLTGTNFTTLAATGTDVKANLDWSKLVWDLDGATNDAGVSFALSDITSATVTNATSMAIDLTAAKQSSLQATTGFAADGLDTTNTGDQIDITAGFTRDSVGNASTTDGAANLVPTYADSTAPTVSGFSSSTANGSYNSGDTINITATMTESILAGSQMSVTLDTNDIIELTATQNGTTLSGTYTVSSADSDTDLGISSFSLTDAAGNTDSVIDAYGNAMSSTTMPAGQNLSDNAALVIDNQATFLPTTISVGANPAAGATFALTFNEAVGNQAAIGTEIGNNAAFGATATKATTAWSADGKTATVTLGAGETLNADMTLTLASILDLAGNEATSVAYTLDIA